MKARSIVTASITGTSLIAVVLAAGIIATHNPVSAKAVEEESATLSLFDSNVCVFGWSKDSCNGYLKGEVEYYHCQRIVKEELVDCRTYHLRDAEFRIPLKQSNQSCDGGNRCDATAQLDGTLQLRGNFIFGYGQCAYRGAWEGEWRLIDNNGALVASGIGSGTLGTGSHRPVGPCLLPYPYSCGASCESCYDVTFVDAGDQSTWQVGMEGALRGDVFAGEWAGSTISITLAGMLNTGGNAFGPYNFGDWFFCGNSDGVVLARCE